MDDASQALILHPLFQWGSMERVKNHCRPGHTFPTIIQPIVSELVDCGTRTACTVVEVPMKASSYGMPTVGVPRTLV